MDEVEIRPGEQFRLAVAQGPLPRRVDALEVAVEPGDAEHVERQDEEPVELFLRAPSVDEQADLVADAREHRQQVLVGCADLAAEELHHAEDFAAQQDGESKCRVQPFARGDGCAREVRVLHHVGDPDRLGRWPRRGRAGRSPRANVDASADGVEFREICRTGGPDLGAAQHVRLAVDRPERAVLPAEGARRWPRESWARPR